MGWQRVRLDWVAELNWNVLIKKCCSCYTIKLKNKPKPVFYSVISFKNCLFMCECVWYAHKSCMKGYMHVCMLSCFSRIWFFVTPWTIAHQAPLSMGFSRQEYWNGLPNLPPKNLLDLGIKPVSLMAPALQENSLLLSHWGSPEGYIPIY